MPEQTLIVDHEHDPPDADPQMMLDPVGTEPMNPLALLSRAVEKGMDPGQLKALVDLHEQWRAARAVEAFNAAMNVCQAEMPTVVRDGHNTQTKSTYAKLENVTHTAKPIYTRHGFSLSFAEDDCPTPGFKRTICDVRHAQGHCVRYHLDLALDGIGPKGNPIGNMNAVQAGVSTGSYGQRVLTCRIFNITVADTDLDGQRPAHPNPERDASQPRTPPRAQRVPITEGELKKLLEHFKANTENPTPDVFRAWVERVTFRKCDAPLMLHNWTKADLDLCWRELTGGGE